METFKDVVDRFYSKKNPTSVNGLSIHRCEQGSVVTKVSTSGTVLFDSLSEVNLVKGLRRLM